MNFKPFYIHRYYGIKGYSSIQRNMPWGLTARIEPCPDNPREVLVAVAFCSQKDQFCKATGRCEASQQSFNRINIRHLPKYLAEQDCKLFWSEARDFDFNYVLKYVV
jgi:hypothetical protein